MTDVCATSTALMKCSYLLLHHSWLYVHRFASRLALPLRCGVFLSHTKNLAGGLKGLQMAQEQQTVSNIFRRAQSLRLENPQASYKDIRAQLLKEFKGAPFPPTDRLTIPEQDARAPEEDWSAGLPLVMRGIQQQDWKEVINGIMLSLEQTENYEQQRGGGQDSDTWHDRTVGISEPLKKGVNKWMPEELMALAERQTKKP